MSATTLDTYVGDAFRGDPAKATAYTLVVNKHVSPPQDLSSPSVRDLYLQLKKGEAIEGSFKIGSFAK